MNKLLGTNKVFKETAITAKVRGFFKPTIVFLLIYFVGSLINGLIVIIPTIIYDLITGMDMFKQSPNFAFVLSLFGTVGTIIAAFIYCKRFEYRSLFTYGFTKKGIIKEYTLGLGIGLVLFSIVYGIIIISEQAEFIGFNTTLSIGWIIITFLGFMVQGMSEEVLLRSYYFTTVGATKNMAVAVMGSSVIFAVLHLGNSGISLLSFINLIIFGIFAAVYYLRRGNIWGIGAIHSMWNFAQGNIFGCKVSGNEAGETIFNTNLVLDKGTFFSGNEFGPEGGFGFTIVFIIGIAILLFMKNKEVEE